MWSCTLAVVTRIVQCRFEIVERDTGALVEPPTWWEEPAADLPLRVLIAQLAVGALLDGTSVLLTPRDSDGYVTGLWVPENPTVAWGRSQVSPSSTPEVLVRIGGTVLRPDQRRIVRHPLSLPGSALGASPLRYGLQHPTRLSAGGIAQRLMWYLRGFSSPGILSAKGGEWDEDSVKRFYKDWDERYAGVENAHRPLLLDDVEWKPLSMSFKEMQALESEEKNDSQIAAAFGLDNSWINANTPGQSLTYANLADRASALLQGAVNGLVVSIEDAFAGYGERRRPAGAPPQFSGPPERGVIPADLRMHVQTNELTRSDEAARFLMIQRLAQAEAVDGEPILTIDEKREKLGYAPMDRTAGGSVNADAD